MFTLGVMEVYTFVDEETGENTHIDAQALRKWCARSNLEVVLAPVDKDFADRIIADNAINMRHIDEVAAMPSLDPVIYCAMGTYSNGAPDVMLADGHHRYYLAWRMGKKGIPAYLLQPEQWQPFVMHGLPTMTMEELRKSPGKFG